MASELFLYDEIGPGSWGLISSAIFAEALAAVPEGDDLTLRINSPGGDVFEGMAIFEAIRLRKGRTIAQVDALAGSIASVIPLAADEVRIAPRAFFAIHKPSTIVGGEAGDLRKAADRLDTVEDMALDVYKDKVGNNVSRATLRNMLAAETWFDAQEAVEVGLADAITLAGDDDEEHEDMGMGEPEASETARLIAANFGSGLIRYSKVPQSLQEAPQDRSGLHLPRPGLRSAAAAVQLREGRRDVLIRKIDLRRP